MRKKLSRASQRELAVSATNFVEEASEKASWLVRREVRGPGDLLPAMTRIESRYGIPYSVLWALRYRKPRDLLVSTYARIIAAYDAECERQRRLLDHEQAVKKATTVFGEAMDRAAFDLVAEEGGAVKK